ncbi:hypothetical protein [Parendozoicomonas haliclonae]|uniref:Uncharacterized protein n=1 Tax=Parendozoicomonas haliclonae TaxID=1960125 RepID=A0A1X7AQV0_9GAMM|nr:hypothetical protein [Parendozoicomonas haliclonae]SMA50469.1 hypothetical protein EHSB41UT_04280 [Parendozoicomonas haliclonae]
MSGINFPNNMPPTGLNNINTAMANFEEEKSFFALMYVVISPNTRRWVRRRRTRAERERERSSLGRVIRRFQAEGQMLKKHNPQQDDYYVDEY